ncbi:MAG: hypothetical protein P4L51_09360 [Puia sp.]|nr:hypothetical protein [Puia sp.]
MTLIDLEPYLKLYNRLRRNGEDTTLNDQLLEQEKEFIGKSIVLQGIIKEMDVSKNEVILTYKAPQDTNAEGAKTLKLISNLYFIFASSGNLAALVENPGIEKEDLVKITGNITGLHRNSVIRLTITAVSVIQKQFALKKRRSRP